MHRWFLVRHGQTEWNRVGRAQGHSDPPLNAEGHGQARAVADRLRQVEFAGAYTSDLSRAAGTAEAIMSGRDTPLIHRPDLREQNFGEWEGLTYEEVRSRYTGEYEEMLNKNPAFVPPGGESDTDLLGRMAGTAARIAQRHAGVGGNILVVTHGGAIRAMIVSLLKAPADSLWQIRLSNAGLSIVTTFDEGGATIDLLNDTSHLGPGFDV